MSKKIYRLNKESEQILTEFLTQDGKIIQGAFANRSGETSINAPNEEGDPPSTSDKFVQQTSKPLQFMLPYMGYTVAMTESTIKEDVLTKKTKPTDLISKNLTREQIIKLYPLTINIFKEIDRITSNINKRITKEYGDNVEEIKTVMINDFLNKINYEYLPDEYKKTIFSEKK